MLPVTAPPIIVKLLLAMLTLLPSMSSSNPGTPLPNSRTQAPAAALLTSGASSSIYGSALVWAKSVRMCPEKSKVPRIVNASVSCSFVGGMEFCEGAIKPGAPVDGAPLLAPPELWTVPFAAL